MSRSEKLLITLIGVASVTLGTFLSLLLENILLYLFPTLELFFSGVGSIIQFIAVLIFAFICERIIIDLVFKIIHEGLEKTRDTTAKVVALSVYSKIVSNIQDGNGTYGDRSVIDILTLQLRQWATSMSKESQEVKDALDLLANARKCPHCGGYAIQSKAGFDVCISCGKILHREGFENEGTQV